VDIQVSLNYEKQTEVMFFSKVIVSFVAAHFFVVTRSLSSPSTFVRTKISWKDQWKLIKELRMDGVAAAVDTMGAHALSQTGNVQNEEFRFQTLVATMLSPQTRDQQTMAAFENLRALVHPQGLRASVLLNRDLHEVENAIKNVSFFRVKAKNILEAALRCKRDFGDDIPTNIDDLLSFKGVGNKIAYLTFTIAHNKTVGICVDTHVHRISNRLGWVDTSKCKSNAPDKTRQELEKLFPHEYWGDVNGLLVGFGQTTCTAKAPKCNQCTLRDTCKFYAEEQQQLKKSP
jgi:endonuclease III